MSNAVNYRRTHPLMNYLFMLVVCVCCYLLYLQFVVPVVEVTGKVQRSASASLAEYHEPPQETEHHPWFKEQDWERQPCSVLRTAHGKILFDDYSREDPKTWLVHPFTMLLEREADPKTGEALPPIILRCQTGARLHFAKPVASVGGNSFQLERAQLEGNVELYRRISSDSDQEDIRIETSNIQINESQILSIDDVAFRFGNNQGVGRHLTMQLRHHGTANQLNRDISRISGITNIRLGILSSMLLKPKKKRQSGVNRVLANDQSPIEVTSRGPFEFDFQTNLARFIDQVRVRKMDTNGDSLACDELILQFRSDSQNNSIALDSASDQEFELESIVAQGTPVVLNARSQNARITGNTLDYNVENQVIQVAAMDQVEVLKDGDSFVCKTIKYHLDQDNRLGELEAIGAGRLNRKKGDDVFFASWSQGLKIKRKADRQHLIQLRGDSSLQLDSETSLGAKQIDISIWEVPVYDRNHKFVRWSYQPDQLYAVQEVHVHSERLIADSNSLKASWPENPQMKLIGVDKISQFTSQVHVTAIDGGARFNQPTSVSFAKQRLSSVTGPPQVLNRPNYETEQNKLPVTARGDSIQIVVVEKNGKSNVTDMQMAGNVTIQKPRSGNRHPEFKINGDQLRMIPIDNDAYEIKVSSNSQEPAQVLSDQLKLTGKQLFLDQIKNSMWVKGQGRVQINSDEKQNDSLDVTFQGGMIFDGNKIYFEQDVVAKIRRPSREFISETRATGTALSVTLDQKIQFKEAGESDVKTKPKVVDMTFIQHLPEDKTKFRLASLKKKTISPVVIRNRKFDPNGQMIEQLVLQSPYVKFEERKNELNALGPGLVQMHRRSNGSKGPQGFGFVGNRNGGPSPLIFIHSNFDNQLIANQKSEEIVMTGNLRSIYSPVDDFNQTLNPDENTRMPDGAIRLHCDRVDLIRSRNSLSPKPQSEFIASGNAHIQSNTIDTRADRISYRDDTDILTVASASGKDVILKLRQDMRSNWQKIAGQELIYRVADKTARVRKVGNVSATFGTGK